MKPILIMGPTASGKSALALALAEMLGGEIVNADSMQAYRDLCLLSARPSAAEEARAPHHLYGAVDASERYSTGRWLEDVTPALAAIAARGKTAIVVGGTGLYFKALTEGLSTAAPGDADTRTRLRADLERDGAVALHARLAAIDAAAASRIKPNDSTRILRALEVHEGGGDVAVLSERAPPALTDFIGLALTPDRAALYAAIEVRFDLMIAEGALDEVRALVARNLDPNLPAMKALGVGPLAALIRGEIDLPAAIDLAKRDTRRYAKRQFTWINNQMPMWHRITAVGPSAQLSAIGAADETAFR